MFSIVNGNRNLTLGVKKSVSSLTHENSNTPNGKMTCSSTRGNINHIVYRASNSALFAMCEFAKYIVEYTFLQIIFFAYKINW
jgi:hypothetical protein